MPLEFPLRKALATSKIQPGVWLTLPNTAVAHTLASIPQVTWVCVDGEHGLINDTHYFDICNSVASRGVSPIIRVPSDEIWMIKRALDAGAHGIMVPQIHTAAAARRVVQASKYGPPNVRGFAPMFTHASGATGAAYAKEANDHVIICVQIESKEAIANIGDILKEGIDCAFIGPFDLAVSSGMEFGSSEHDEAIQTILAECQKANKLCGIFCINGESAATRVAQGFNLVSMATDIDSLASQIAKEVGTGLEANVAQKGGGYAL